MAVEHMDEIINVTVNRETQGVSRAGFGTAMALLPHTFWSDRVKYISDQSELAELDPAVPSDHAIYRAAVSAFSQPRRPSQIGIGRIAVKKMLPVFIGGTMDKTSVIADGTTVSLTVNDKTVVFTGNGIKDVEDAVGELIAGLAGGTGFTVGSAAFDGTGFIVTDTSTNMDGLTGTCTVTGELPDGGVFYLEAPHFKTITVNTVTNDADYTLTFYNYDGVLQTATYHSDATATEDEVLAGLHAALGGLMVDPTIINQTFPLLDVANQVLYYSLGGFISAGAPGSWEFESEDEKLTVADAGFLESFEDGLTACRADSNDWYGLTPLSRNRVEQIAAVDAAESIVCLQHMASADTRIQDVTLASDEETAAYYTGNVSCDRTLGIFCENASGEYAAGSLTNDKYEDFGWLCGMLAYDPDLKFPTWANKRIGGGSANSFTTTQKNNIFAKKWNVYWTNGGLTRTFQGWVGSGEFADTILLADWLDARMTEDLWQLLGTVEDKISLDDEGVEMFVNKMRERMKLAIDAKGLRVATREDFDTDDEYKDWLPGGYFISSTKVGDMASADRAARKITGLLAKGKLAGAIHSAEINITVQV